VSDLDNLFTIKVIARGMIHPLLESRRVLYPLTPRTKNLPMFAGLKKETIEFGSEQTIAAIHCLMNRTYNDFISGIP
jgi:hypothetical protein